jgi:hypothetical protein
VIIALVKWIKMNGQRLTFYSVLMRLEKSESTRVIKIKKCNLLEKTLKFTSLRRDKLTFTILLNSLKNQTMKKNYLILFIAVVVITACQQKPKTDPIDIEAEKAAIDSLFDKLYSALSAQDVTTLASFLTEDALCIGTDPSEFWNKQQMTEMWTQMLADSAPKIKYINERKLKVAADANSATVVEQYTLPDTSPKILWRNAYHLVKTNGNWMILVVNCSFILKNDDIPKLIEVLD